MDIVDVDGAVVGESAPGKGNVGPVTRGITGPEMGDFPALIVEFAAQFAGNINDTGAAIVITHIKDIVDDPNIVGAGFGNAVGGDFARMGEVGNVQNMCDSADGDAFMGSNAEDAGKNFVANENIVFVAIDRVRASEPA